MSADDTCPTCHSPVPDHTMACDHPSHVPAMPLDEAANRVATMVDAITALQVELDHPAHDQDRSALAQACTALAQAKTQLHVAGCYIEHGPPTLSRLTRLDQPRRCRCGPGCSRARGHVDQVPNRYAP